MQRVDDLSPDAEPQWSTHHPPASDLAGPTLISMKDRVMLRRLYDGGGVVSCPSGYDMRAIKRLHARGLVGPLTIGAHPLQDCGSRGPVHLAILQAELTDAGVRALAS